MRALVFVRGEGLFLRDVPVPEAGEGDVLLKVLYCTVCGSDLRVLRGEKLPKRRSVVLGHEVWGEVVESKNPLLPAGLRVSLFPSVVCGACGMCLSGRENLCENKLSFGSALDGGFAEYLRVPRGIVDAGGFFASGVDGPVNCLLEPLGCVIRSFDALGVKRGDRLLIVGAGPLGLMHLVVCGYLGVEPFVVDRHADRLEVASRLIPGAEGASDVGGVEGRFDAAVFCAPCFEEVERVLGLLVPGGRLNLFAGGSWDALSRFSPNLLHYRELVITGTHSTTLDSFKRAAKIFGSVCGILEALITHVFSISDYKAAFETYATRRGLKVAVSPWV